jgi:hypothetical protein
MDATTRRPLAFGRAGRRHSLRHWKQWNYVRCRLVASWGWSRSQGLGCSPIKAARELGLERRETVKQFQRDETALSINSAKCWKLRASGATRSNSSSNKVTGADNQQGRPLIGGTLRGHTPNTRMISSRSRFGEDMVRPPWRHGEPGGKQTTWPPSAIETEVTEVSVPILRGRRRFAGSCP